MFGLGQADTRTSRHERPHRRACWQDLPVRFLSSDWLASLDHALSSSEAVRIATAETSLRLLQVVTGTPEGDIAYLVTVAKGSVHVSAATPGVTADVTLASDWPTAIAVATGDLAPHDAFTAGRLQVRGDTDVLRREAPALAGLSAAFTELRAATTFA